MMQPSKQASKQASKQKTSFSLPPPSEMLLLSPSPSIGLPEATGKGKTQAGKTKEAGKQGQDSPKYL
jgi:hypothetical protein